MEAVLRRGHGERLGRLGTFEVVEMRKHTVDRTRERLARARAQPGGRDRSITRPPTGCPSFPKERCS